MVIMPKINMFHSFSASLFGGSPILKYHLGACLCVCTHVEARDQPWTLLLRCHPLYLFWDRVLTGTWGSLSELCSKPRSHSPPPQHWDYRCMPHASCLCRRWDGTQVLAPIPQYHSLFFCFDLIMRFPDLERKKKGIIWKFNPRQITIHT